MLVSQYQLDVLESRAADYLKYMPEKIVPDLSSMVMAPMPGMVKTVNVTEGQKVFCLPLSQMI